MRVAGDWEGWLDFFLDGMKLVETTKPTASRAIELLAAAGVLVETTGKKRDRSFVYRAYLDRLRVGTELRTGVESGGVATSALS